MRKPPPPTMVPDLLRVLRTQKPVGLVSRHSPKDGVGSWGVVGDPTHPKTSISTPLPGWSGVSTHVQFLCSFCSEPCDHTSHVEFNQVLTSPYIASCGRCVQKMSNP